MPERIVSPEEAADERIRQAAKTGARKLNLAGLGLTRLPENIGSLTHVTRLDLSENRLVELPSTFQRLTGLRILDLRHNALPGLPSFLCQLIHLEEIHLDWNCIEDPVDVLGSLKQLQMLSLSNNLITILPLSLRELHRLRVLNLSSNRIAELPHNIDQLTALHVLYLNNNNLSVLPSSIGNLTVLERLELADNCLTQLPDSFSRFSALRVLDVRKNKLTTLDFSIGELRNLTTLDLSENALTRLPNSLTSLRQLAELSIAGNRLRKLQLGALPSLETLDISGNHLTSLSGDLVSLQRLQKLNLSNNRLSTLPEQLYEIPSLSELYLHENDDLGLPPEILGSTLDEVSRRAGKPIRPADLLAYYFEIRHASRPLNEVKLLIVGRGGTGKSSIRDRLVYDSFDKAKSETPGIQIDRWRVKLAKEHVRVHVWDFAGQEITHATHRFFLTERSIYLLVLDARADTQDRDAEYWLRLISAFAKESPVIIAMNKWDDKPFDLDRFALRERYSFIRSFIATDCDTSRGIAELSKEIRAAINKLEAVHELFPAIWIELKNHFSESSANYLTFSDFQRVCVRFRERDPERQARLARTLHALGIILHYADDPRLRDTTVLNPHWVTRSIYKLLRLKDRPTSDGTLTLDEARQAIPAEDNQMVTYLMELMCRFELCFPLDDLGEKWLVPELLSRFQPELGKEWSEHIGLRLRYDYKVMPEGIMPRFITRTYPLSVSGIRWRNGVVLEMSGGRALVKADLMAGTVGVSILGTDEGCHLLAKLIRNHFQHIHADINGLDPLELVEVEGYPGSFEDVRLLEIDERAGNVSTVRTVCGSVAINQTLELNRISVPAARDLQARRLKLFLSYSYEDSKLRDVFMVNLSLLEADGLIDPWFDGRILPSREWDKEIRQELEESDIVVFLISTAFLQSPYIRGVEMKRAVERRETEEVDLVSVILEDCAWEKRPFTRYQLIRPGGKSVRRWTRQRDAFNSVEGELRKVIALSLGDRTVIG